MMGLLVGFTGMAQEYRISIDGFVMPDMNTPVTIFAESGNGAGYKELPVRKYQLESTDARLAGNSRHGYSFLLDRDKVYRNNGKVHFDLIADGKRIPLVLHVPIIKDIRFNLYTDSIKPVLNYYVNVEGIFSNEQILPLDTNLVFIESDQGIMNGMEWIVPKQRPFDKVTFTVTNRYNPTLTKSVTLYLKKATDPRDAPDYQDRTEEEIRNNRRRR